MAEAARTLPASAWRGAEPLGTLIKRQQRPAGQALTAIEKTMLGLPAVREALGAGDGELGVAEVVRLAGHEIYTVSTVGGTAHCQSTVFLSAKPLRLIDRPPLSPDMGAMCWTQSGSFATVMGRPAYVAGGSLKSTGLDEAYTVHPWTGRSWGPACSLKLSFVPRFEIVGQLCATPGGCRAFAPLALEIVAAHDAARQAGGEFDASQQVFGRGDPGPAVRAAVARLQAQHSDELPTFGRSAASRFFMSHYAAGATAFALKAADSWHIALIGRSGVGWRESKTTLLTVYGEDTDARLPLASFQVELANAGLREARAEPLPAR